MMVLFFKAQARSAQGHVGDLFEQKVPVKAHVTKTGAFVAEHQATRKKKKEVAYSEQPSYTQVRQKTEGGKMKTKRTKVDVKAYVDRARAKAKSVRSLDGEPLARDVIEALYAIRDEVPPYSDLDDALRDEAFRLDAEEVRAVKKWSDKLKQFSEDAIEFGSGNASDTFNENGIRGFDFSATSEYLRAAAYSAEALDFSR